MSSRVSGRKEAGSEVIVRVLPPREVIEGERP